MAKSDLEIQQAAEITELKKALANKNEEVAILKKLQRTSLKPTLTRWQQSTIAESTREHTAKDVAAYVKYYNLDRLHSINADLSLIQHQQSLTQVSG